MRQHRVTAAGHPVALRCSHAAHTQGMPGMLRWLLLACYLGTVAFFLVDLVQTIVGGGWYEAALRGR